MIFFQFFRFICGGLLPKTERKGVFYMKYVNFELEKFRFGGYIVK